MQGYLTFLPDFGKLVRLNPFTLQVSLDFLTSLNAEYIRLILQTFKFDLVDAVFRTEYRLWEEGRGKLEA
jgi:hypothetical protein